MLSVPQELAKNAVQAFLTSLYDKKTEKEQKQLAAAIEDNDANKISILEKRLADAKEKYSRDVWIATAAERMAKQLNFGTHISKGIHPDSKGDNVSFKPYNHLPKHLVGTHSLISEDIDANGNAAALPLAAFFDFAIDDTTTIRDLIVADNPDFIDSLASDKQTATAYHQAFKAAIENKIEQPVTSECNKQMLWAVNANQANALEQYDYVNIVPLYPSVLTHEVYQRINHLKFSDDNKSARDNRFKQTTEQRRYVSLLDLATVQLGGTKPQNVSMLMSKQGGRNYLLPSMPPIIGQSYSYKLSKFANSLFGKNLAYHAHHAIEKVYKVVKDNRHDFDRRKLRKAAIDEILQIVFAIAHDIRTTMPAGWSKEYDLDREEKLWLDPKRADLEGEESFKAERENPNNDWDKQIMHHFARWLNALLQSEFKDIAQDFADPEHFEWEREIEDMRKLYERAGKGVFL